MAGDHRERLVARWRPVLALALTVPAAPALQQQGTAESQGFRFMVWYMENQRSCCVSWDLWDVYRCLAVLKDGLAVSL